MPWTRFSVGSSARLGGSEVERLQSIPGVGVLTALALHVEIQTVDRFPHAEALVSYFGLDPVVEQSGDDRWHVHTITKKGRAYVRGLMTQAAWVHVARAKASGLTATYERLRERKGKQIAIVATARRWVKGAYHVLDEQRMFERTQPTMASGPWFRFIVPVGGVCPVPVPVLHNPCVGWGCCVPQSARSLGDLPAMPGRLPTACGSLGR
jgi:hypothetical protein